MTTRVECILTPSAGTMFANFGIIARWFFANQWSVKFKYIKYICYLFINNKKKKKFKYIKYICYLFINNKKKKKKKKKN